MFGKKNKILKISALYIFIHSFAYAIPTFSIPQSVENVFTEIRGHYTKLVTWQREITQWKQQYKAITEFRLKGNALEKFTQINNLLNEHGLDMGDLDLENPVSKIGIEAKKLFENLVIFDDCTYDFFTEAQTKLCKNTIFREVEEMAMVDEFSKSIKVMLEKVNDLNSQLSSGASGSISNDNGTVDGSSLTSTQGEGSDGGSVFEDFSSEDTATYNEMMNSFSEAEGETNSEDNTIKLSQDVTAGLKSINSTVKAMKIKYKMLKAKNKARQAVDARQQRQIYMQKFKNVKEFHNKIRIK